MGSTLSLCDLLISFQSIQLFMSVAVNQPGIDYHVVLAQNALQHCLDMPELQTEMICILIKQTSRHMGQKLSVGVQVNKKLGKQTRVSFSVAKLLIVIIKPERDTKFSFSFS